MQVYAPPSDSVKRYHRRLSHSTSGRAECRSSGPSSPSSGRALSQHGDASPASELHPVSPPKTPKTPQWKRKAKRERRTVAELSVAHNEIWRRGRDAWDADRWLELREHFLDNGSWDMVGGLLALAGRATSEAIRLGKYYLPPPDGVVSLTDIASRNPITKWFGMKNAPQPEMTGGDPPPLICSMQTPLDLVAHLKEHFDTRRVCMAIEVTDYSLDGARLRGMDARNQTQQELFLRTDFESFAERATKQVSAGNTAMRNHLTALEDPYVFSSRDVTMFRSSPEEGYSFLKEPIQFDVVVSARCCERPDVVRAKEGVNDAKDSRGERILVDVKDSRGEPVEFFAEQDMFVALMERLNLIGLAALDANDLDQKPILVISVTNLRLQPRHSIARALKYWRRSYASCFEGVVLACGEDRKTAELLDEEINSDILKNRNLQWHWDTGLLELSVNSKLIELGEELSSSQANEAIPATQPRRFSIHDNIGDAMQEPIAPSEPKQRRHSMGACVSSRNAEIAEVSPLREQRRVSTDGLRTNEPVTKQEVKDLKNKAKDSMVPLGTNQLAQFNKHHEEDPPRSASTSTRPSTTNTNGALDKDLENCETESVSSLGSDGGKDQPPLGAKAPKARPTVGTLPALAHSEGQRSTINNEEQLSLIDQVRSLAMSVDKNLTKIRNTSQGRQKRVEMQAEQNRRLASRDAEHAAKCDRDTMNTRCFGRRGSL